MIDPLGQVVSLCELTSGAGTVSCTHGGGQWFSGYMTTYTYNALGKITSITTQTSAGTQTRSFTYDGLGRMLTETYPESGTTTYTYDSASGCSGTDARNALPWWLQAELLSKQQGLQLIFQRSDEQQRVVDPGLGSALMISDARATQSRIE